MSKVTFDYSKTGAFISQEEIGYMKKLTLDDTAAFLSKGLKQQGINVEKSVIANWLLEAYKS